MEIIENILGAVWIFFKNPILYDVNGNLVILDLNWWFYLGFILLYGAIITTLSFYFHKKVNFLEDAFNVKMGYIYLISVGFLGMHHFYLLQKKRSHIFWILVFVFIISNLHLFGNFFTYPQYIFDVNSYSYFSRALILLLIFYLIRDAILMHYYCYKQNNNLYRIHFEKDLIIGNKKNEIDKHLSKQKRLLNKIDASTRYIDSSLKNESFVDNTISSVGFFKNVLTLGKAAKLNKEVSRLKALENVAIEVEELLRDVFKNHEYSNELLERSRIDVYRNLILAKEMVGIIKKINSKNSAKIIRDNKVSFESVGFKEKDLEIIINSTEGNTILEVFKNNFSNHANKHLKSNKNWNKENIIESGLDLAIDIVEDLVQEIGNLNKEVTKRRSEVALAKYNLEKSLLKVAHVFVAIKANTLRVNEILKSLNEVNKIFIKTYEPLREKAFPEANIHKYLNQKSIHENLINDQEFWKDVHLLVQICNEYNKINNAKII